MFPVVNNLCFPLYNFDLVTSLRNEENLSVIQGDVRSDTQKVLKSPDDWKNSLGPYKTNSHDTRWVYAYTPLGPVVYDKYPKSRIHLLFLPYDVSYYDFNFNTAVVATKPRDFRYYHLPKLYAIHNICKQIAKHLETVYRTQFTIGYHLTPTMNDLHIHIISTDYMYIKKNKQDSFKSNRFITIDEVCYDLENYGIIKTKEHKNYNKCSNFNFAIKEACADTKSWFKSDKSLSK
jgi:hypothetical protein